MSTDQITKAVIPAAGLGTRLLPATKVVPKELMPLVDRPALQVVADEALGAGLDDVAIITRPGKEGLLSLFAADPSLEAALRRSHNHQALAEVRHFEGTGSYCFINQAEQLGLGHAVLQAREFVGKNPCAVLLPDDIFHPEDPLLARMIEVRRQLGGSVVALLPVDEVLACRYGSPRVTPLPLPPTVTPSDPRFSTLQPQAGQVAPSLFELHDIVEKPAPDQVRSAYGIVGRYVLDPLVFEILADLKPGVGGEIQLTEALNELSKVDKAAGGGVYGLVTGGRRFDTGDKLGYLQAVVELGVEDAQIGTKFAKWLGERFSV